MIPISLRIAGFLSYVAQVELDFTGFDMACISGANGAGKSSLLDAITWCLFGEARTSKDEMVVNSSKNVNTAEVSFVFGYERAVYRVARSKTKGKTPVLEFQLQTSEGGWKVLTRATLRATQESIIQTLRLDYETFINASFFLQGKADQFAQMAPGKRKEILASILGLEVWEEYKNRAAERRKVQENEQAGVERSIKEKTDELAQESDRRAALKKLETDLRQAEELRKARQEVRDASRKQVEALKGQRGLVEQQEFHLDEAQRRLEGQKDTLNKRKQDRDSYRSQVEAAVEIRAAYRAWQDARAEVERWNGVFAKFSQQTTERGKVQAEIDKQQALLEQEQSTLSQAQADNLKRELELPSLEAKLKKANELSVGLINDQLRLPDLEKERDALTNTISELDAQNKQLNAEADAVKKRIAGLKDVEAANCPLCGQPLAEPDRLALVADLDQQLIDMRAAYSSNQEDRRAADVRKTGLNAEINRLRGLDAELHRQREEASRLNASLMQTQAQIDAWRNNGALRLAVVERQLAQQDYAHDSRQRVAQIDAELRELGYDDTAHRAAQQVEKAGQESEKKLQDLVAAESALQPLESEIGRLEKQVEDEEWKLAAMKESTQKARKKYDEEAALLPDMDLLEDEVRGLQEEENRLHGAVGAARQKVDVLVEVKRQYEQLFAQKEEISRLIDRLRLLEVAFGKNGVPAQLIEEALPEIEAQANDILDRLSDGAMSVRFRTLREGADKKRVDQIETLDIIISDTTGERAYEMFSGGEAFRINFAIRLALSRVLAQRAGARLQTLVIDEGFGSQDAEGLERLKEALILVKPDFAKVLVITHLDSLKDVFPARIEVEKTPQGSQVKVVG